MGRWLQRDPIGYIDALNMYEVALSNSLVYVDALGLIITRPDDLPPDPSLFPEEDPSALPPLPKPANPPIKIPVNPDLVKPVPAPKPLQLPPLVFKPILPKLDPGIADVPPPAITVRFFCGLKEYNCICEPIRIAVQNVAGVVQQVWDVPRAEHGCEKSIRKGDLEVPIGMASSSTNTCRREDEFVVAGRPSCRCIYWGDKHKKGVEVGQIVEVE